MEAAPTTMTESPAAREELLAIGGLCVATFGWASAFIAGKVVLAEMTPLVAASWRHALAALVLLPFALRGRFTGLSNGAAPALVTMVFCGGIIYPWLFHTALARTSAINTSLLVAMNPVFTVLLAPLVGEPLARRRLMGVMLALTGAAWVITRGDPTVVVGSGLNLGDLMALGCAMCWAIFNLAARRTATHLSPALTNTTIYGIGSLSLAVIAAADRPLAQLASASSGALTGLVLMSLLSSVLAGQLFLVGVRTLGVTRSVVFVYLVPVLTALLSAIWLRETFGPAQLLGGTAVLAGVYFSSRK